MRRNNQDGATEANDPLIASPISERCWQDEIPGRPHGGYPAGRVEETGQWRNAFSAGSR